MPSSFAMALATYVDTIMPNESRFVRHIPDYLFTHINTLEDFRDFVAFLKSDWFSREHLIDWEITEVEDFLIGLEDASVSEEIAADLREVGVRSDLGFVAYAISAALEGQCFNIRNERES